MNQNDQSTGATNGSLTDAELMQVTPIWEQRGKKKKGFGRTASAAPAATLADEPRTFEAPLPTSPLNAPRVESEPMAYTAAHERRIDRLDDPMLADDEPTLVAPVGRPRPASTVRKGGIAPMAVAAGVVALASVGAAGWYVTRDNDGVPELTPGSAAPATVATADPLPAAAPMPGEPTRSTTVRAEAPAPARTTQVARAAPRARPAAVASSASSTGINASTSAVIPATPQPYSGTAVAPAPAATPLVEAAPPVTTEPVPQPAPEVAPQPTELEPPM